ncbi:MAG: biotin transporter BioY [Andreesenia angusta]|nr:biotin transporter BioY [Andreesenia angusta]
MKTRDIILIALFAGLSVVGAYISIPLPPVPITFQNMICILAGGILGSKKGAISQIVYTIMGLIGLPVFAGGKGGLSHIISPTFGYILGFIICAYIVGKIKEKSENTDIRILIIGSLIGTIIIYLFGTIYLYGIMNLALNKSISIIAAIKIAVLPFFIKDIIVAIVSGIISSAVLKKLNKVGILDV